MAIFRDGVKVGKFDIRTGLSKGRAQGILRELGVLEKKDTAVKRQEKIVIIVLLKDNDKKFL